MRIAIVQMVSTADVNANLAVVARELQAAAQAEVDLVVLPESFALFGGNQRELAKSEGNFSGPVSRFICDNARALGLWIVAGTLPILTEASSKPVARVHLVNSRGQCQSYYDKVHLFDAHVNDGQGRYRESDTYYPGSRVHCCDSPWGKLALSVCYDLRFPELYLRQREQGADYFIVPSAFTWQTGQAHWEVLCRARAIENGCFLVASNQGGQHDEKRRTWGHSMLVDPWGATQSLGDGEGQLVLDLDRNKLAAVRESMPTHLHRRVNLVPPS